MHNLEIRKLAATWIALYHLPEESQEREEKFWAYGQLSDLCRDNPEAAWHVIETIRKEDSSDVILSNLGSGPLEELLVHHGSHVIDRVEALAENDEQFRTLLGVVWQNDIPDVVWKRVKAVAAPSW